MTANSSDKTDESDKTARRTFGAAVLFYLLIAFEFFYMASPFGVYFYSAYGPGLDWLNRIPGLAWLTAFFMPHVVVDTTCPLINAHNVAGGALTGLGLAGFAWGAVQVYYRKLTRRGAATGGLYRFVRHPQYSALMLTGVGMLLLWPRYLAAVLFVTMLFVYHALARLEERECLRRFGDSYAEYLDRTPRFFPIPLPFSRLPSLPRGRLRRAAALLGVYLVTLAVTLALAHGVHSHTVGSLYAAYTPDTAYVSMGRLEPQTLRRLVHIAEADPRVGARLRSLRATSRLVSYVMPRQWYVSEIPMARPPGAGGHDHPAGYDRSQYKIIFTRALLRTRAAVQGSDILLNTYRTLPAFEVWIDLNQARVVKLLGPGKTRYGRGAPVPVL